jgi:hypothetical protein
MGTQPYYNVRGDPFVVQLYTDCKFRVNRLMADKWRMPAAIRGPG